MVGGDTSQLAAVGWDGQRETESEGGGVARRPPSAGLRAKADSAF